MIKYKIRSYDKIMRVYIKKIVDEDLDEINSGSRLFVLLFLASAFLLLPAIFLV